MKSSFIKTHNVPNGVCLCGNTDCSGLTAAFRVLRNARKRSVTLPPYHKHGDNRQRESYLRYLLPNHPVQEPTCTSYIALHHFHPSIIEQYHHKIPKTLSLGQAVQLRMMLCTRDKVIDTDGMPALLFVPNYPYDAVKQDLLTLAQEYGRKVDKPTVSKDETVSTLSSSCVPSYVSFDDGDEMSDISSICQEGVEDKELDFDTFVSASEVATETFVTATFSFRDARE